MYRTGDQIGAWSYAGLTGLGLALSSISFMAVPMSVVWLGIALWLGRQHSLMMASEERISIMPKRVPVPVTSN